MCVMINSSPLNLSLCELEMRVGAPELSIIFCKVYTYLVICEFNSRSVIALVHGFAKYNMGMHAQVLGMQTVLDELLWLKHNIITANYYDIKTVTKSYNIIHTH